MKLRTPNAALAILLSGASIVAPALAQDSTKPTPGATLQYVGADTRFGIGIDSENNARGEIFHVLRSSANSATLGEIWASRDAGGAKLSHHWASGTSSVNKVFVAVDQGDNDMRKATVGGGFANVASGTKSTVGGGINNLASGTSTTVGGGQRNLATNEHATVSGGLAGVAGGTNATVGGGLTNLALADYATIPGGKQALANQYGQMAHASGAFEKSGDAQHSVYVLRGVTDQTMGTSITNLALDGITNRLSVPSSGAMTFHILIVAKADPLTLTTKTAGWEISGVVKTDFLSAAFVGAPIINTLGDDFPIATPILMIGPGPFDMSISVDSSAFPSGAVRWVARVDAVEIAW